MTKVKCNNKRCVHNDCGECLRSIVIINWEEYQETGDYGTYQVETYTCEGFKSGEDNND